MVDPFWESPGSRLFPTTPSCNEAAKSMFSRVTPEVVALLSTYAAIDAFGLTRCGSQDNALGNPLVLLVTGKPEERDWREMRSRIQTILERDDANQAAQLPVELFFGRLQLSTELTGSAASMADPSLSAASMGDELSVAALIWATGSVAGFIRLTTDVKSLAANDPRRTWVEKTYALTCHHVVRPTCPRFVEGQNTGYDPALDELDRTHPAVPPPSRPDESERDLPIQQPDPTTLKAKVTVAENICADTRMKIQEPAFGQVFASSGFRVDELTVAGGHFGSTLDWGLVEVLPGRIGINKLPPTGKIPPRFLAFTILHTTSPNKTIRETAEVHSSQVCKRGAASGITFGDVSADRFVLLNQRLNGGRPSLDWVVNVTARDPSFSSPGDSGGWVYDTAGCLVGSVVGQATGSCTELTANGLEVIPESRDSWSFITPIEATFRDIEKVTGCQVTLDLE